MHGILFNVFKEEIGGSKGSDQPVVDSPHYDPAHGSGECPERLFFLPEPSM